MLLHDSTHNLITAGGVFRTGTLVKNFIAKWWRGRRALVDLRKSLYDAIADIYNNAYSYDLLTKEFLKTADPEVRNEQMKYASKLFYKGIFVGKYDALLERVRCARSLVAETQVFEKVMQLVNALPCETKPPSDRIAAASEFSTELSKIMAAPSFDRRRFEAALIGQDH